MPEFSKSVLKTSDELSLQFKEKIMLQKQVTGSKFVHNAHKDIEISLYFSFCRHLDFLNHHTTLKMKFAIKESNFFIIKKNFNVSL